MLKPLLYSQVWWDIDYYNSVSINHIEVFNYSHISISFISFLSTPCIAKQVSLLLFQFQDVCATGRRLRCPVTKVMQWTKIEILEIVYFYFRLVSPNWISCEDFVFKISLKFIKEKCHKIISYQDKWLYYRKKSHST